MKVLDASFSALPAGWAAARKAEGYGAFIQCLWTGGYANNPIRAAEPNLKQVREAGMIPCGYINTNPWYPASTSIAEAKKNAGAEWAHLPIVFNDIEIAGVTEAQSKAHTEAILAEGKRTAIYSARWFWNSIGNPQWPWLRQYGAWVADYDNDPNLATTTLFGPFTLADVVGKQYTNTTNLAGVQVDFNEFRDDFFQVAQEEDWLMSIDAQHLYNMVKRINDYYFEAEGKGTDPFFDPLASKRSDGWRPPHRAGHRDALFASMDILGHFGTLHAAIKALAQEQGVDPKVIAAQIAEDLRKRLES